MQKLGLSSLTLAILIGMSANFLPTSINESLFAGVYWTRYQLLRPAIVLYGLRLTVGEVLDAGILSLVLDVAVIACTFPLAIWLGTRWLGLDRETSILVGAGASICGAAAVLATEPVVKGGSDRAAIAIASVVVFGSLAMLLYPWLYVWASSWGEVSVRVFSIYTGATVHEVAQVLAASQVIGDDAARLAVTTKMIRVALLAPFLLLLSAWYANHPREARSRSKSTRQFVIPWFAIGFMVAVLVRSWLPLAPEWWRGMELVDNLLLATAMAAVGASTRFAAVRRAGMQPILLAGALFAWLIIGGAGLVTALVAVLPVH